MNIFIIAAWLAIPLSIWLIVYFSARIITHYKIRRDLGDMPSAEEIQKLYQQNNDIIRYRGHLPIVDRSDLK